MTNDFSTRFPRTADFLESGQSQGLHIGSQIFISRAGEILADAAFGLARPAIKPGETESDAPEPKPAEPGPAVAMTPQTLMLWLSAGKPVAAIAIALLWQKNLLDLDHPVARFIPEFSAKNKQSITLRHLLTHTGGFRWVDYSPRQPWDEIIARISAAPLEPRWLPGHTAGYHAFTSWYILAEIIHRLDPHHRDYQTFVAEEIFQPLQMPDCYFAMSRDQYRHLGDRIGHLQITSPSNHRPILFDTESACDICAPGGSGRGPIRQLAHVYEMLLRRGKTPAGDELLRPQTVEALTARHRVGVHDLSFKHVIDWGLGFILNSSQYGTNVPYNFGPYASPRTFGHGGSQSSTAFADAENQLVVAVVFNGMPGEVAHHLRMNETIEAIYEDLGLNHPT